MRPIRPPPRVVPPGPPAHLFEPAEDRLLPRNAPAAHEYSDRAPAMQDFTPRGNPYRDAPAFEPKPKTTDFDKDVEEQMRAIEDNLRKMLEAGAASPAMASAAPASMPGPRAPYLMSYSPSKYEPASSAAPSQYMPPERSFPPERTAYEAPPMYGQPDKRGLGAPLPRYEDEGYRPAMNGRDNLRVAPQERAPHESSTHTSRSTAHGPGVSPQKAKPVEEGGLLLGMDKQSEKELKRRKQEEYRRQLDELTTQNPRSHSKLRGGRQESEIQNPYASPRRQDRPRDRQEEPRRPMDNASFHPDPVQRRVVGSERPREMEDPRRRQAPEDPRRLFDAQPSRPHPRERDDGERNAYDPRPGGQRGEAGLSEDPDRRRQEEYRRLLDQDKAVYLAAHRMDDAGPPAASAVPAAHTRTEDTARRRQAQEDYRHMLDMDVQQRGKPRPVEAEAPLPASHLRTEDTTRRRHGQEEYRRLLDQDNRERLRERDETHRAQADERNVHVERPRMPSAGRGRRPPVEVEEENDRRRRARDEYRRQLDQQMAAQQAAKETSLPSQPAADTDRGYVPSTRQEHQYARRVVDPSPVARPTESRLDPPHYPEPEDAAYLYRDDPPRIYPDMEDRTPPPRDPRTHPDAVSPRQTGGGPISPNKPARARLVTDLYGQSSFLAQGSQQPDDKWRPSHATANPRQREAIADQRAALQQQIEENQRRKDREKEEEKRRQEQLAEEIRRVAQAEQEAKRAEREKKQQEADQQARDMMDLQARTEKEALARKNRALESSPAPAPTPTAGSGDTHTRGYRVDDATPQGAARPPASHLAALSEEGVASPLRDMLDESRASYPYDHTSYPQDRAPYPHDHAVYPHDSTAASSIPRAPHGLHSAQAVNHFMAQYQHREAVLPPRGEPRPGDARVYPHASGPGREEDYYASLDEARLRESDRYRREPPPRDPRYGLGSYQDSRPRGDGPRERYADGGYAHPSGEAGRYGARPAPLPAMGREAGYGPAASPYPDGGDLSVASESRLIPPNPWSSSGIIANLVPLSTTPDRAVALGRRSAGPARPGPDPSDLLEKSMASSSYFTYMGAKTPAGTLFDHDQSMQQPPPRTAATTASMASVSSVATAATSSSSRTGIQYNDQDAYSSSQNRGRAPSKQHLRLHPESLPPAGVATAPAPSNPIVQGEAVQVTVPRRVIQQVIAPTADEVPVNRIFLQPSEAERDQQNRLEHSLGSASGSTARPRSGTERSSRPPSALLPAGNPASRPSSSSSSLLSCSLPPDDDGKALDRTATARRKNVHDANSSLFQAQPGTRTYDTGARRDAYHDAVEHHEMRGDRAAGRGVQGGEGETVVPGGRAKRWELSAEERQHTIKQLAQYSVANILASYGGAHDDTYTNDSFEAVDS